MCKHREFTRQELYDLVWATPIVKLAKYFGLSDVGLRKTCVRCQVPTPPTRLLGQAHFWKARQKDPLPSQAPGVSDRVLVTVFAPIRAPEAVVEAEARAREIFSTPTLVPDEAPARLHPAARALKQALGAAKPDDEGFLRAGGPGILNAAIGPANRPRAVLIVDTLLKALEAAGHNTQSTEKGLIAIVDGESLSLQLGETRDKKTRLPTKSELKAKEDWEAQRRKWPSLYGRERQHRRNWDHFPSGRLSLTLTDPLRSRWQDDHILGQWRDRKAKSLEVNLTNVLVGMLTGAATVRHNRIAAETAQREREQAHQAYLREQERLRCQAQADAFIEAKADQLARLQKVLSFRDYISKELSEARSREEEDPPSRQRPN